MKMLMNVRLDWIIAMIMLTVPMLKMASPAPVKLGTQEMEQTVQVCTEHKNILHFKSCLAIDIDECTLGTDTCDEEHADCTDMEGSYSCMCHIGYTGDGEICCMSMYQ